MITEHSSLLHVVKCYVSRLIKYGFSFNDTVLSNDSTFYIVLKEHLLIPVLSNHECKIIVTFSCSYKTPNIISYNTNYTKVKNIEHEQPTTRGHFIGLKCSFDLNSSESTPNMFVRGVLNNVIDSLTKFILDAELFLEKPTFMSMFNKHSSQLLMLDLEEL